ncbi:hypothetical protein [Pandoraea sputorum]|uniref:Uncharacterized protein n=1 Tax=Pandoraea sputorum TaxID=93222 RepID=A0A5E5BGC6_9BURK|nr:hypothetical protein [Pandoraea sputorum]VVE84162.1 hypothetical protein PSP31121_04629 [Pandoraea sputorum]
MDVNSPTNAASIAAPNFPADGEPPSSGSFSADLTATHQATTTQSLDSGTSDDWARIRGGYIPPETLMDGWRTHVLVETVDDTGFGKHLKEYQDALAKERKDPTLVTTALAAHIDELGVDSLSHALMLLLNLDGGPDGVTFNRNTLETLADSRWIECFMDDETDYIRTLIRGLR